jgi:hypothetical protein
VTDNRRVPPGRLDHEPASLPTAADRHAALYRGLRGVGLGAFDERMVRSLAALDDATVTTVVSWLERARLAERVIAARELDAEVVRLRLADADTHPDRRDPPEVEDTFNLGLMRAAQILRGLTDWTVTNDTPGGPGGGGR